MLRFLAGACLSCIVFTAEARNSRALQIPPEPIGMQVKEIKPRIIAINPQNDRAADSNDGFGNVQIGTKGSTKIGWTSNGASPTAKMTLGGSSLSGSAGYKITKDGCKGVTVSPGSYCWVEISYNFTSGGMQNAILKSPWSVVDAGYDPPLEYSGAGTNSFSAFAVEVPPEYEQNPAKANEEAKECGSIVRIDSQTLGEEIPVVGAGFNFVYTSANAKQFVTTEVKANRLASFNPEGMSVSIHHYYDRVKLRIFEGSGGSRFAKYLNLEDQRVVASADGEELYYFDSNGRHMTTRHALTGTILRTFNYTNNKLTSIVDAYGNTTTFIRNSGVLSSIIAPFGQTTMITTSGGLISSVKNPMGQTYLLAYKSGTELLERFTKPGGQYSMFTYDSNGRLTRDASSAGNKWDLLLTLMSDQRTTDKSSALSRKETYYYWAEKGDAHRYVDYASGAWSDNISIYNNGGNEYQEESYSERTTTFPDSRLDIMYDRPLTNSKIVSDEETGAVNSVFTYFDNAVTDFSGLFKFGTIVDTVKVNDRVTATNTYTASTRTFLSTSPQGATSTKVIDQFGKVISSKVGNDVPWSFVYDSTGRLSAKSQGSNLEQYIYNSSGHLQSVMNARNEVTEYSYDLAGRLTQIKLPDNRLIGMTYDANGNKTSITPPAKPIHKFVFNAMELLSSYQPPALTGVTVKDTTYSYNMDKQLTQITRPDARTVKYVYGTSTGRLEQVQVARGIDRYTYKPWTDRIEQIDSADGIRTFYNYFGKSLKSESQGLTTAIENMASIRYSYDSEHRISSRVVEGGGYTSTIATTYNGDSVPIKIGDMSLVYSYPSGRLSSTTLDRISDSRTYDTSGNLLSYTAAYTPTSGSATTLYKYTLTRDVMGRIIGKTEIIGGVTTTYAYQYDVAGRLTLMTRNGATNSSFVYDANGNRISGVINGVAFVATYDNQDRLTKWNSATYTYNANGDNTGVQNGTTTSTFTYDAYSRLLASVVPSSNYKYQYDGKGRQVRVYNGTTGATAMRRIYEDGLRVAAEFNDAGVINKEYVYGSSVNSPDYVIISGVKYKFIKDHLGSPRLIVKSSDGTIAQRIDYDVLGKVTNNTKAGFQAFGFAGGQLISSVGLTKFGARWYDANIGRWTSKDPIRFEGGNTNLYGFVGTVGMVPRMETNLYGYALQDPINYIDPTGLYSEEDRQRGARFAGAGVVIGAVAGVCTSAGLGTAGLAFAGGVLGYAIGVAPGVVKDLNDVFNGTPAPDNIFNQ